MRPFSRRLWWQAVLATFVLAPLACNDSDTPTRPGIQTLFTTPTGLVTANPPQVFVGAGDISSCSNNNDEATAKLLDSIPGTVYNLGDDAYDNGTTSEFNNCYDPTWGREKARTHPSPGNHEYNTSGAAPYFAYFGAAAGTAGQGWYSFNLGAWHIISLNSNISLNAGGAQDTWLKADLAAHPNQCTLAYYHHPLYSSTGGTGTGGLTYSSSRLFVNDLYAAHADLILNGHRHFYERLAPMNPSGGYDSLKGVRELIAGTGGIGGGSETDLFPLHEAGDGSTFGVLKLWLYDDSYAWKFVPIAGKTYTDSGSTPCHSAGSGGSSVSAANSTVSASPTAFTAGSGSSTITVTAKDGNGNVISGASVTVTASGSGNTLTPASGTTNGSGVFTSALTATVAEVKTISATISGTAVTQTASVTVNPASSVSASLSTVVASPTSFTAGGSSTITVTVVDGSGNPLSGIAVTLSATGSGNTITQPAVTDASGVSTGTVGSTGAGSHTVTAVAGGVTLNQQPVVAVTAGSADANQSTVTAQPTSITVGTGASTITVTVKDVYGNPVSGAMVVLAATGSGNTLTGGGATNTSGVAIGTLSSTVAETKTVSAAADGVAITQTASVTVATGSAITQTLLTSGHDPTNTQTFTTASIAPAPNTLVTVAVLTHQATSAAPSPTLTGGGMTGWDLVASVVYDGATPLDRLTIYRAMSSAPGSGPITITSSVTVSNCQWIVSQWSGVDGSGTNGSGAIVQTGSASGTAVNGLTVPLAAFASTHDVTYGAFGVASATPVITAGSGFTTIDQQPSGESTVGDLLTEWALNQPSVTATWSSKNAGALGVEIKAGP